MANNHAWISRLILTLSFLSPAFAQAADAIVFVSETDWGATQERRIHLMRPDGSAHRLIATRYPVQSASIDDRGDWIVYTTARRKELRRVHVSGRRDQVLRNLRHITGAAGPGLVTWSPDGKYILYTRGASTGAVGIEIYDVRRRRIVRRVDVGYANQQGTRLSIRRVLWAPDSKHYALVLYREGTSGGLTRKTGQVLVFERATARIVRDREGFGLTMSKPHGFASSRELFEFDESSGEITRSKLRSLEKTVINDLFSFSRLYNLAISPNGAWMLVDGTSIHNGGFANNWRSLVGTPRGEPRDRNFILANVRTLAALFVTPLTDYSALGSSTDRDSWRAPNFEWRTIASDRVFHLPTCWGWVITHRGTNGADRIVGTAGADVIAGRGGNDVIQGRGGNDILCGGPGNDVLIGGAGNDIVFGDVDIGEVNHADIAGAGADVIRGSAGADALHGNGGDDKIDGGSGNDRLLGGGGNDFLNGAAGLDTADGGTGTDDCVNVLATSACE